MSEITDKTSPQLKEGHTEADHIPIPSPRKLKANQENAKKSTGPRTSRGKAYSRRNAIKHGLFARMEMNLLLQNESWSEFEELLADLRERYKPAGPAEESEIKRLAQCSWKFQRAWRFENAQNRVAAQTELVYQRRRSSVLDEEDRQFIQQLESLRGEIESTGDVPADLKKRVIAIRPDIELTWTVLEAFFEYSRVQAFFSKVIEVSKEELSAMIAMAIIAETIEHIREVGRIRDSYITEGSCDRHAIPNSEALDRMVRYESAIDRNFNHALDRLERFQRARRGNQLRSGKRGRLTRQP